MLLPLSKSDVTEDEIQFIATYKEKTEFQPRKDKLDNSFFDRRFVSS